jgi:hypothetical protein
VARTNSLGGSRPEQLEVKCKPSNSSTRKPLAKQLQTLCSASDAKPEEGCNRRDWNRRRERVLEVTQDEPPKELITDVRKCNSKQRNARLLITFVKIMKPCHLTVTKESAVASTGRRPEPERNDLARTGDDVQPRNGYWNCVSP